MAAVTSGAQRVVVADDSRLMRRMLSDALGRQGFEVVATAADGDEALAACRTHRPDALTLDLAMLGMDGIGVLRALRAGRADPPPLVVGSALSPAHGAPPGGAPAPIPCPWWWSPPSRPRTAPALSTPSRRAPSTSSPSRPWASRSRHSRPSSAARSARPCTAGARGAPRPPDPPSAGPPIRARAP